MSPSVAEITEAKRAAHAWAVTLRTSGTGWLMVVQDLPPVLDRLVEAVEELEEAVASAWAMLDDDSIDGDQERLLWVRAVLADVVLGPPELPLV